AHDPLLSRRGADGDPQATVAAPFGPLQVQRAPARGLFLDAAVWLARRALGLGDAQAGAARLARAAVRELRGRTARPLRLHARARVVRGASRRARHRRRLGHVPFDDRRLVAAGEAGARMTGPEGEDVRRDAEAPNPPTAAEQTTEPPTEPALAPPAEPSLTPPAEPTLAPPTPSPPAP